MFWRPEAARGYLGQWYPSPMVEQQLPADLEISVQAPIGTQYQTAEQRMMYMKALMFGDQVIAMSILQATSPKQCKALGRQVSNFDQDAWNAECEKLVEATNWLKFTQNPELMDLLLATGTTTLVEASPLDRIWGIGMTEADARHQLPNQPNWGTNFLGKALERVRTRFHNNQ